MSKFSKTLSDIRRLPPSKKERALRLLDKAEFMDSEMCKLQEILANKGWTEEYMNGATQNGLKKSSEADCYISLSKAFLATMKQIEEMVRFAPDENAGKLQNFLNGLDSNE